MRCDDGRRDYKVTSQALPIQPGELVDFADMAAAGVAADGERLVVTVEMAMPMEGSVPNGPKRFAGVELLFQGERYDARNTYHVSFKWPERTATFGGFKGGDQPVQRSDIDAAAGRAEIPLTDLPKLGRQFQWRAQSGGTVVVSAGQAPDVLTVFDSCPGAGDSPNAELLTFSSKALPPETGSTSTTGQATSTTPRSQLVGLRGAGGPGRPAIEPGPDCQGASACVYDNGVDFTDLRDSIAAGVEPAVGQRPEVDCDRPNLPTPPNQIRVGQKLTCTFALEPGVSYSSVATVEVEVLPEGSWRWEVKRTEGD